MIKSILFWKRVVININIKHGLSFSSLDLSISGLTILAFLNQNFSCEEWKGVRNCQMPHK